MAAARASWPASIEPSSWLTAFSTHDAPIASDTVLVVVVVVVVAGGCAWELRGRRRIW